MTIRVLSAEDIDRAITPGDAVEAMRSAFAQLSDGSARVPVRGSVESELGVTLLMPAFLGGSNELGAKIVSVFPDNADAPPISGAVIMLDANTGLPRAVIDGTRLTALRTAAGSALATELLASEDADVLAVFGAGTQGRSHIEAISATRELRQIQIFSRTRDRADALARDVSANLTLVPPESGAPTPGVRVCDTPADALSGASMVCAATTSATPVFDGGLVEPGAHVNAVGSFTPQMQEVDVDLIRRARVVVDQREATWEEAGDLIIPLRAGEIDEDIIAAELGEIVNGAAARGRDGHEVTYFKSVGNAAQDVAIAALTLERAEALDVGTLVSF